MKIQRPEVIRGKIMVSFLSLIAIVLAMVLVSGLSTDALAVCSDPAGPGVDWSGCDKSYTYLEGANLYNANLTGARLAYANLTGANLTNATLTIATNLGWANLAWANLTNVKGLISDHLRGASSLTGVILTGMNLSGFDLRGLNLPDANLRNANLTNANLKDANLFNANLISSNLTGATLTGANLGYTNLNVANLTNADLTAAIGVPVGFDKACLDSATCPSGAASSSTNNCWGVSVNSIVIDPANEQNMFAGIDAAGVYRSANSGTNWNPATTQPTNLRVKAVVIKPGDGTKLYAATYGSGVYTSADSGDTWSACANTNLTNLNAVSLTIDPNGTLYAGTETGVFMSTNACATWTAMNNSLPN